MYLLKTCIVIIIIVVVVIIYWTFWQFMYKRFIWVGSFQWIKFTKPHSFTSQTNVSLVLPNHPVAAVESKLFQKLSLIYSDKQVV